MKRSGVRTRTLGLGWEERYLAAVRKARERGLVPAEAAERLRRYAGAYFCAKCQQEHRTESDLGKRHLRLQAPAAASAPARKGKAAEGAPLPVQLTADARRAEAPARVALTPRGERTAARVRSAAAKAAQPALRDAKAASKPAPRRRR